MFTGCRKHELIYAKPVDLDKVVEEHDEESDAYKIPDIGTDQYTQPREKICWVCKQQDKRTVKQFKVLY